MTSNFVIRSKCPVCGKEGDIIIDEPYCHPRLERWISNKYKNRIPNIILNSGRYVIRHCHNCKMLYQGETLSGQWLYDLYENWTSPEISLELERDYNDSKPFRHLRSVGFIPAIIPGPPAHIRVLDFGAGWGTWALIAKSLCYCVYVSEISEIRKAYCKSAGLTVVDLDLENLGEFREYFNYLHIEQVFEHLSDPAHILAVLLECLKPGGGIYIGVPNANRLIASLLRISNLNKLTDSDLKKISPFQHVNCFSSYSLLKLAQTFGLQRVSCRSHLFSLNRGVILDSLAWLFQPYRRRITSLVFRKPL